MFNRKPRIPRKDKGKVFFQELPSYGTRIEFITGGKNPHWEIINVNLNMQEIIDALNGADARKKQRQAEKERLHRALDDMGDVDDDK